MKNIKKVRLELEYILGRVGRLLSWFDWLITSSYLVEDSRVILWTYVFFFCFVFWTFWLGFEVTLHSKFIMFLLFCHVITIDFFFNLELYCILFFRLKLEL